jgi:Putative porin
MKQTNVLLCAVAMLMCASIGHAQESGALLDLLVKKGVITDQEAEEVRAELVQEYAATPAGKINLSTPLTELKLSGDLRLRYQWDDKDEQAPSVDATNPNLTANNDVQRSRWRFRLRLNADFKLLNDIFGGVQLVTAQAADSDNQTFEDGFSDYDIYISRAYLGWHATDWLTLIGGKQPNPFYTTDLVWDADINPTGAVEIIRFHKMHFGGGEAVATGGYSKDGKSYVEAGPAIPSERDWELTLNLGQFIYDDNPESAFDNDAADNAYLFVGQLVGSYDFGDVQVTLAPGFMFFNAADVAAAFTINENEFTAATGVSGETRDLFIVTAPGEVAFKFGEIPLKLYWDFAYNTNGEERAEDIYGLLSIGPDGELITSHADEDDFAFLAGIQVGQNKIKGDWSINANYRQTGIAAVDPNLNDSDFALGELNTRGFKLSAFVNLTDFMIFGVSYYYAWNLRDNLIGGHATGGERIADSNVIQIIQVDLNMKF